MHAREAPCKPLPIQRLTLPGGVLLGCARSAQVGGGVYAFRAGGYARNEQVGGGVCAQRVGTYGGVRANRAGATEGGIRAARRYICRFIVDRFRFAPPSHQTQLSP